MPCKAMVNRPIVCFCRFGQENFAEKSRTLSQSVKYEHYSHRTNFPVITVEPIKPNLV